eukprot:scaffold1183_cov418-Prasinococcus_capsulatus_cf.AAC.32
MVQIFGFTHKSLSLVTLGAAPFGFLFPVVLALLAKNFRDRTTLGIVLLISFLGQVLYCAPLFDCHILAFQPIIGFFLEDACLAGIQVFSTALTSKKLRGVENQGTALGLIAASVAIAPVVGELEHAAGGYSNGCGLCFDPSPLRTLTAVHTYVQDRASQETWAKPFLSYGAGRGIVDRLQTMHVSEANGVPVVWIHPLSRRRPSSHPVPTPTPSAELAKAKAHRRAEGANGSTASLKLQDRLH